MSLSKRRKEGFELTDAGIDAVSGLVAEALFHAKTEHKEAVRLRLAVEEVLLLWKEHMPEGAKCSFGSTEWLGHTTITVAMQGPQLNPAELENGEDEMHLYSILAAYGGAFPAYDYVGGENRLILNPNKKRSASATVAMLLTLVAAVIAGLICRLLPQSISTPISQIMDLVFSSLTGILGALAGPLIFFSICVGIINLGDASAISRIGKTVLSRLLLRLLLILLLTSACFVWFFTENSTAAVGSSGAAMQILTMLFDIIPKNLLAPFVSGNSLQIVLMAVAVGVAMLILGNKISLIRSAALQANYLIQAAMRATGRFLKVLVFSSVFCVMLGNDPSELSSLSKGYGLCLGALLVCPLSYAFIAAKRLKVSYPLFLKKIMPGFLLGFTTASSAVALPTVMESCKNDIGISRELTSFAVPLGQVLFKVGAAVTFIMSSFIFADYYGIAITLPWVMMMVICCLFLSIAIPAIPGCAAAVYTILLAQAGIPAEAISIALAGEIIMDFMSTGASVVCLQSEAALTANKLGRLNKEVLRSK